MMEKITIEKREKEFDSLKLWNDLLNLFGTEEARENFKNLCREYQGSLAQSKVLAQQTAEGLSGQQAELSDKVRAKIHNQIMAAIYRLMTQAGLSPEERRKFSILSDRKKISEMIDDVFGVYSPREKEKIKKMTPLGRFRKEEWN